VQYVLAVAAAGSFSAAAEELYISHLVFAQNQGVSIRLAHGRQN